MRIIYELNPPKIFNDENTINYNNINQEIDKFVIRTNTILEYVDYIHITDSVLGIPRISSIHGAAIILENIKNKDITLSCSVRTRDRNISSIIQFVTQAIFLKIKDLLFIMGDKPQIELNSKPLQTLSKPTDTINMLNSFGYNKLINLNLSVPNKILKINDFEKKINANPHGLITQSINSLKEIKELNNLIKSHPIKLIPCVMVPSIKNLKAAKIIGLDWEEYETNFIEFIKEIRKYAENVLISSPNDFNEGVRVLKELKII
jgi:5,10-methylenetetrahydrofolate reductase